MFIGQMKGILKYAAISGITGMLLLFNGCASPVQAVPTPTPWPTPVVLEKTTYTVKRGTIEDKFQLSGNVAPVDWATVFFRADGDLDAIKAVEGDQVKKGAVLGALKMPSLLEQLNQAKLNLEQTQDQLTQNEGKRKFDLERAQLKQQEEELALQKTKQSGDQTAISIQEVQLKLAQLDVQEIQSKVDPTLQRNVTKAQSTLADLQRQVEERNLIAPFDGQVVAIGIGLKDFKSSLIRPKSGDKVTSLTPVLIVAKPTPLEVTIAGDAKRASELKPGQVLTITHPWTRNQPFLAEVFTTPSTAKLGSQTGGPQLVHVKLPAQYPQMAIGDTVDIDVLAAVHKDVLVLPQAAIRRFAGRTFVVVQEGDRQRRADIELGLENSSQAEIKNGLNEGDVVVGP